jgi:hypothetical protein
MPYILQIASGAILPILKEAMVKLTLGQPPTDDLYAHDVSVDLGHNALRLAYEEVPLWLIGV